MPATAAMKTICRTLSSVNGVMTSVGMMPVRKSSQEPGVLGLGAVLRGEAGAGAGVGEQADGQADGDRDQRGDHEPQQRAGGQPGGVVDLAQVGDRHQDREEDERGDGQLQQLDEDVADLVERGDEPGDVLAAGDPAEQDAEDEAGEDLRPEGDLGYAGSGAGRASGCRPLAAGSRNSRTRTHSGWDASGRTGTDVRRAVEQADGGRGGRVRGGAAAWCTVQTCGNRPRTYSGRDRHAGAPRAGRSWRDGCAAAVFMSNTLTLEL